MRNVLVRLIAAVLAVVVVVQLVPGVPDLPVGVSPASAQPVDPVPPPEAVDPDPYQWVVEDAGPTEVAGPITTNTVWDPQGSPYLLAGARVASGVTLTLLPGTVVKVDLGASLTVEGQLLALGTPDDRVVFTSIRDDSIMGDTNGDGDDTSPARGDWVQLAIVSGAGAPVSIFDYVDVRYGGNDNESCVTWGAIKINTTSSRAVVANSRFTEVQTGIHISGDGSGYAGVYNSLFASGRCGLSVQSWARAEVVGNTFNASFIEHAFLAAQLWRLRSWFNTVYGPMEVYNLIGDTPTQEEADFRFNALLGPVNHRPSWLGLNPKTDWSMNWFGHDANDELPTCMDPDVAAEAIPPIETQPSEECPSGQEEVVGYHDTVLPALSGSPQVLPASAREAAAPRFGPVNTYTGELTYQVADLAIEDAGKQVTATRTYRSDQAGGDAGVGWTSAFSESLSQSGDLATLTFSDGSSLGFLTDPAAGYVPAPGVAANFSTDTTGTTVTTPGQTGYHFDVNGELYRMTLGDDGHELTVERSSGQVDRVVGESGRYLEYDRSAGRLDEVTDNTGSGAEMAYTGDRLSSATGVDGQTETYTYDTAGRLTQVTTPEGRIKLAAEYGPDGRVAWVEQQGVGRATFAYDDVNATRTITLDDGTVITQQYDWAGRLLTERIGRTGVHVVYDGEGRVVSRVTGLPDTPMRGFGPAGAATLYDRNGDPVVMVDPTGRFEATTYDDRHQPLVTTRRDGSTISRTYDGDGRLVTLTGPLDNEWSYTYNDRGQVLTQTDPLNRVKTLAYDSEGDLASVTDETGSTTTYGYDNRGRRTSTTDPLGNVTQLAYTAWGEVRQVTRPRGGVVTVAFDDDRLPVSMTDEVGAVTSYGYDPDGRLDSVTDALGNVTSIAYDDVGRPVQVTDARGSIYQRTYSPEGWVTSTTDPLGHTTSYEHDPLGRVLREIDPLDQITQAAYDLAGRVTRVWTPDGALWRYGYDQMGRHNSTIEPRLNNTWTMEYDLAGRLTTTTDPEDFSRSTAYDEISRVTATTDQDGVVTSYAYDDVLRTTTASDALGTLWVEVRDAAGRIVSEEDGAGVTTTFAYDEDGNVVEVTDPAGTVEVAYDLAGRATAETDATGRTTAAAYDLVGRLTTLTHPDGESEAYAYDPVGNLVTHTDQAGAAWTYTYDAANQLLTETDALGGETTYTYDELGRQTSVVDPTGVVSNVAYDPMGRPAVRWAASGGSWVTRYNLTGEVVEETAPDGVTYTHSVDRRGLRTETAWNLYGSGYGYSYDGIGRLISTNDPYPTTWTYDIRGRVETVTDALGNETSFEYDGAGRPTRETLPSGRETTWTYDPAGRLATATDGAGNTSEYTYDPAGRLTQLTLPRGGFYDYAYDDAGRLESETDPLGEATTFGYDPVGRLSSTTYPSGRVVQAGYDDAGRQTSASAGSETRTFGYDDAGRLTSATTGTATVAYAYNDRGLLEGTTDASGDTTYTYDLVGRLTSRQHPQGSAITFEYDNDRGRLRRIEGPDVYVSYTHNRAGQIVEFRGTAGMYGEERSYDSAGRLTNIGVTYTNTGTTQYADSIAYTADGQVSSIEHWGSAVSPTRNTDYAYDDAGRLATATVSEDDTVVSTTEYEWDDDGNRTSVATTGDPTVTATYDPGR